MKTTLTRLIGLVLVLTALFAPSASAQYAWTTTTLNGAITTPTANTITLTSGTGVTTTTLLYVDRELMRVTDISASPTFKVTRTVYASLGGTHATLATVTIIPANYFGAIGITDRAGSCTATSELALPVFNVQTGVQFNCSSSAWIASPVVSRGGETLVGTSQPAAASPAVGGIALTATSGAGGAQSATTGNGANGGAEVITGGIGGAGGSSSGTGGTGGASTITAGAGGGTITGGAGGASSLVGGAGGSGSTTAGTGGAALVTGGAAVTTAGTAAVGGAATVTAGVGSPDTGSGGTGGAGGVSSLIGGAGGAASTGAATGGAGGALALTGGAGGGTITGGAGGAAVLKGGAGANGSTAGGSGGDAVLQGGAVGTGGTGSAGLVKFKDAADVTKVLSVSLAGATTATTTTLAVSPAASATVTLPGITGGVPVSLNCGATGTGNQTCSVAAATVLTKMYAGTSTLSSNAAVITFPTAFAATTSYQCVANDITTRANPVQMLSTSTTTATITNTTGASDVINWICVGQ